MEEFVPPNDITIIGGHPNHYARDDDPPGVRHKLCQSKMQVIKKFPNKGMNREMKATGKVGLVKITLVSVRVTSPLFVTRDPNFY